MSAGSLLALFLVCVFRPFLPILLAALLCHPIDVRRGTTNTINEKIRLTPARYHMLHKRYMPYIGDAQVDRPVKNALCPSNNC